MDSRRGLCRVSRGHTCSVALVRLTSLKSARRRRVRRLAQATLSLVDRRLTLSALRAEGSIDATWCSSPGLRQGETLRTAYAASSARVTPTPMISILASASLPLFASHCVGKACTDIYPRRRVSPIAHPKTHRSRSLLEARWDPGEGGRQGATLETTALYTRLLLLVQVTRSRSSCSFSSVTQTLLCRVVSCRSQGRQPRPLIAQADPFTLHRSVYWRGTSTTRS